MAGPFSSHSSNHSADKEAWLNQLFPQDAQLLTYLSAQRGPVTEIDALLERLKVAQKSLSEHYQRQSRGTTPDNCIDHLIQLLVSCLCCCAENIRLGRGIEKLFEPLWVSHGDLIKSTLVSAVTDGLHKSPLDGTVFCQVSAVLDLSVRLRNILADLIPSIMKALQTTLENLTQRTQPSDLSSVEHRLIYTVVKVCLQLFKCYPDYFSTIIWSCDVLEDTKTEDTIHLTLLSDILYGILYVLQTEGFSTDCVLLSGTATVFLLNTAPTPELLHDNFHKVVTSQCPSRMERIQIGQLDVKIPPLEQGSTGTEEPDARDDLRQLALVRGFVTSLKNSVLAHSESFPMRGDCSYILQIFDAIYGFCITRSNYLAFQLLFLWYKKLTQVLSQLQTPYVISGQESNIRQQTFQLIITYHTSRTDGVSEYIIDVCKMLLEIWQIEKDSGKAVYAELAEDVLQLVVRSPWTLKARYKLLKILSPYIGISQVVCTYPELYDELLDCLTTNYLASTAADVYKSSLTHLKKEKKGEDIASVWSELWWNYIRTALTSEDSLQRHNARVHLIPSTLKVLPALSESMQGKMTLCLDSVSKEQQRQRALLAWLSVMIAVRSTNSDFHLREDYLLEAAHHPDDDVRSAVFSLLSTTLRTAEPLCDLEDRLIRRMLHFNVNIDSAPFRQRLVSDMKKLAVRCRDSSLVQLKYVRTQRNDLCFTLSFVDWLLNLCVTNLQPGVSFQRRKTCLEILQVLLQAFTCYDESKQKRGQDPENIQLVLEFALSLGMLEFYSAKNWLTVLHCFLDGTDEVRNLSSHILLKYFPWPVDISIWPTVDVAVCHILSHGLELSNSSWSPDNHSGSLLCHLIYKKFVIKEGWVFGVNYDPVTNRYKVQHCSANKDGATSSFLNIFFREINDSLIIARQHPFEAAKSRPIQGMFSVLNRLIEDKRELRSMVSEQDLNAFLEKLQSLCIETSELMLDVLAGGDLSESCLSLAEIGTALEKLLPDTPVSVSHIDANSSYRPLLTWCANNTKESTCCLGQIVEMIQGQGQVIQVCASDTDSLVSRLENIGEVFIKVFTMHRHWGAIDGCRLGFMKYCTALFSSPNPKLCSIPRKFLDKVLDNLSSLSTATSVTRRSAGLPVLIQSVIVSEKSTHQDACLKKTLNTVLAVATSAIPHDFDQTYDLPQVHAINVLNTLFGDSRLASQLSDYVGSALTMVINGFCSHSWAIRNAATQLLSTLVSRIFGQMRTCTASSVLYVNNMSFVNLYTQYPELLPLIVSKFEEANQRGLHSIVDLHPALFPILTLMSNLAPHDDAGDNDMELIREVVCQVAYSPVYSLRELAAKAYPAVYPPKQSLDRMKQIISALNPSSTEHSNISRGSNVFHGSLLQVEQFLQSQKYSSSDLVHILDHLLQHDWLFLWGNQPCDLVKAKFLELLSLCLSLSTGLNSDKLQWTVGQYLTNKSQIDTQKVGYVRHCEERVRLTCSVFDWDSINVQEGIHCYITDSDPEMKRACVRCLQQQLLKQGSQHGSFTQVWKQIQGTLFHVLPSIEVLSDVTECLRLIITIYDRHGPPPPDATVLNISRLGWVRELHPDSSLSALVTTVTAICIQSSFSTDRLTPCEVFDFCATIHQYSRPDQSDQHRRAAAKSLCIVGPLLMRCALGHRTELWEKGACHLIDSTLTLLQSEQSEMRKLTSEFVCLLPRSPGQVQFAKLHSAICLEVFCDFLVEKFQWSSLCAQCLLNRLYSPGDIVPYVTQSGSDVDADTNGNYLEMIVEGQLIHKTLKRLLMSEDLCQSLSKLGRIQAVCGVVTSDLSVCCQSAVLYDKECPVFNVMTSPVVQTCLVKLLLCCDVVINGGREIAGLFTPGDSDMIHRHFQKLKQVQCLQPFLEETLRKVDLGGDMILRAGEWMI